VPAPVAEKLVTTYRLAGAGRGKGLGSGFGGLHPVALWERRENGK